MKSKGRFIGILATLGLLLAQLSPVSPPMKPRRVQATGKKLSSGKKFWGGREELQKKIKEFYNKEDLPEEFNWVYSLTPLQQRRFICSLKDEYETSCFDDDWDSLETFLDSWYMVAIVEKNPKLKGKLFAEHVEEDYTRIKRKK